MVLSNNFAENAVPSVFTPTSTNFTKTPHFLRRIIPSFASARSRHGLRHSFIMSSGTCLHQEGHNNHQSVYIDIMTMSLRPAGDVLPRAYWSNTPVEFSCRPRKRGRQLNEMQCDNVIVYSCLVGAIISARQSWFSCASMVFIRVYRALCASSSVVIPCDAPLHVYTTLGSA